MNDLGYREQALLFKSHGEDLVGIVTTPERRRPLDAPSRAATLGVVIVVGGPQYRVGSHRQFVLLARALAARGLPVLRFDCTGMGDSTGPERPFTERDDDIRAAIGALMQAVPEVGEVALWGLCDAASAALFYAADDARVTRLVLLNPWVRSDGGLARTHLKHYYTARLVDRAFWADLLRGRVGVLRSLRELLFTVRTARKSERTSDASSFQARMARGWKRFTGPILLICSGDDLTAREFLDHSANDGEWRGLLEQGRVARCSFGEADHTFSRAAWRDQVAGWTADWLATGAKASRLTVVAEPHEAA